MNIIDSKLRAVGKRTAICFAAVFANGTRYQNREGTPAFTLMFRNAAAEAIDSGDRREQREKVDELLEVVGRFTA